MAKRQEKNNGTFDRSKLQRITVPQTENENAVTEWNDKIKGAVLGGYIRKVETFKNRKNGKNSAIIHFDLKQYIKNGAELSLEPGAIKLWRPAMLRDLINEINIKGYVEIVYQGKELKEGMDNAQHSFDLVAELPLNTELPLNPFD